ncbi:unnamed protein product [Rhizophagus irregularis]|uniref:Uncharacterized protein n=1 Tax=Rhizophagus irregularis TaxID=588596 RepID=A0A916EC31_9GLOM|nr:unnamed protein product [Rhizophagus irregularis]CAB5376164.1 unnamed protein product [Rhizophagus irregularis]
MAIHACCHFYKILRTSPNAKWHISTQWYKDDKLKNNDLVQQAPISLCIESSSDNAISINSYDELIIGLFQGFLSSKQSIDTNHVISTWEGRPPSRAKSTIEVQYSQFHMQRKENCY